MKIYLMQNDKDPLDKSLFDVLGSMSIEFQALTLPDKHNDVPPLLNDLQGGVVFLPGIWKDLFCVKTVQEISHVQTPFETVIVDGTPEVSNLIVAFNEGLSAYLETPVTEERLQQIISRTKSCFDKKGWGENIK